jgi:hypothetical protein
VKLLVKFSAKNLSNKDFETLLLIQSGMKGLNALLLAKKFKDDEFIFDNPQFLAYCLPYLGPTLFDVIAWQKESFKARYLLNRPPRSRSHDRSPSAYLFSDVMSLYVSAARKEDIKSLLRRGAHIKQTDSSGQTPLHLAISAQVLFSSLVLLYLVSSRLLPCFSLSLLFSFQSLEMMKFLLDNGADPNQESTDEKTPLFAAVSQNNSGLLHIHVFLFCSRTSSAVFFFSQTK